MNVVYDANGSQVASVKEYDIVSTTAIAFGQVVKLTAGKVVLAVVGETSPLLGVAFENHPGVADALNMRSQGTRIKVEDAATSIFECAAPKVTATSGSTTTIAVSGLATVFADTDFVGGKMKLIAKGATSTITDALNTIYPITTFTTAAATFTTTATIGGGASSGDVFAIFPPIGFQKGNFDATIQQLVLTATCALPLIVTSCSETARNIVQFEGALMQLGNKRA